MWTDECSMCVFAIHLASHPACNQWYSNKHSICNLCLHRLPPLRCWYLLHLYSTFHCCRFGQVMDSYAKPIQCWANSNYWLHISCNWKLFQWSSATVVDRTSFPVSVFNCNLYWYVNEIVIIPCNYSWKVDVILVVIASLNG